MKKEYLYLKNDKTLRLENIIDEKEIIALKKLDDEVFKDHEGIELNLLRAISNQNGLWAITKNHEIIGETQIATKPITPVITFAKNEAFCYGTAVKSKYRGQGLGEVLGNLQEKIAIREEKNILKLSVRPENCISICMRLKLGFKIYDYDPYFYGDEELSGGRLLMKKNISNFNSEKPTLKKKEYKTITIRVGDNADLQARNEIKSCFKDGFQFYDFSLDRKKGKGKFIFVFEEGVN